MDTLSSIENLLRDFEYEIENAAEVLSEWDAWDGAGQSGFLLEFGDTVFASMRQFSREGRGMSEDQRARWKVALQAFRGLMPALHRVSPEEYPSAVQVLLPDIEAEPA